MPLFQSYDHFFLLFASRTIDTASLEFGAAPEAVSQVQPALRLKVANIISTPSDGKPAPEDCSMASDYHWHISCSVFYFNLYMYMCNTVAFSYFLECTFSDESCSIHCLWLLTT